jgi:DNA (cytosine-5)-methyltransferase 1
VFSGVGGLSLGAARAGFNVAGAVELDPHPSGAHRKNFPRTEHFEQDIRLLSGKALKKKLGLSHIDGIVGGPPCQGFSSIGHRDKSDPRNLLFSQFFRVVSEVKPKFFLAENVPGILDAENDPIREAALSLVEDSYEVLDPIRLVASSFGAPTSRERIFFIGYRKTYVNRLAAADFVPPSGVKATTVKEALAGLPTKVDPDWQSEEDSWKRVRCVGADFFSARLHNRRPDGVGDPNAVARLRNKLEVSGFLGTKHSTDVVKRFSKVAPGKQDEVSKCVRLQANGLCPTLRAGTGKEHGSFQAVRPLHPSEDRVITPREGARLQGFPDWFQFSPTKWHSFRQLGNSVSPILAECVLRTMRRAIKG